jgi:U6 snRNA-associated Sm-like protein LSm5
LDDAVEFSADPNDRSKIIRTELKSEVLLNGNQIADMVPGGAGPPEDSMAAQRIHQEATIIHKNHTCTY